MFFLGCLHDFGTHPIYAVGDSLPLTPALGEPFRQSKASHHSVMSGTGRKSAPSPWGEGRGEGDRDVRTAWIGLKRGVNEKG